jgi:regulator of nucleoside diphosphate kinase
MTLTAERPIIVTSRELERLRGLAHSSRRRWEELHLRALAERLDDAEVLEPSQVPADVVTMRSRVRVLDAVTGEEATYTICYPADATGSSERLSVLAPIGTALLGNRQGDIVRWPVPGGVRVLKIVALLHQPEAAARRAATGEA